MALRLLAIYLLIPGLTQFPTALASLYTTITVQGDQNEMMAIYTSLFGITYLIACAAIWTLSPRVAKFVEKDLPQLEAKENEFTTGNVLTIGVIILGFFVISKGIPALVKIVFATLLPSFDSSFDKMLSPLNGNQVTIIPWSDIVSVIVQIAIGIWFILGSKGIVSFLKKVRYAGRGAM